MTRDELIDTVKEVAGRLGVAQLSRDRFLAESGVKRQLLLRHFDGWTALCRAAGIAPVGAPAKVPDAEVFEAMRIAFLDLGGVPTIAVFEPRFKFAKSVFYDRGWSWPEAKARFRAWIVIRDPDFPYLDQLPEEAPWRRRKARPQRPDAPPACVHQPRTHRLTGERIDFRAMARAPVNELGVVALFCMVAQELGYSIELMNATFPDCEAMRLVTGNRWERVRIEFEYESRNFLLHKHDPAGCDVIVCWIANWRPDGIEVLELGKAIRNLPPDAPARAKIDRTGGGETRPEAGGEIRGEPGAEIPG
jgi:hypothetical protein